MFVIRTSLVVRKLEDTKIELSLMFWVPSGYAVDVKKYNFFQSRAILFVSRLNIIERIAIYANVIMEFGADFSWQ